MKPDFSKIDFSKVDFGSLKGRWSIEMGHVGLLKLSTVIDSVRRTVATMATLDVEPWQIYFDRCVNEETLRETALAIDIVDAFIASQPKKKWAVKTPYGYQWKMKYCNAGFTRDVLLDNMTGERDRAMELRVKLAKELLELHGSVMVDLNGNMSVTFNVQCEEV